MSGGVLHAFTGVGAAYAAVQVPMLIGLARGRAAFHHFVMSPIIAAPLTLAMAVGSAMSTPLLVHLGITAHGAVQTGIALGLSALLGYAGGRAPTRSSSESRNYQRGARVADAPSSHKKQSRSHAITLAGIEVPALDEAKHFKLIGTTGTGKSTAIQEILTAALARGDRAVIADPDGGYQRRFFNAGRGDVVMNPFEANSVKWDLFAEIKSSYDVEQLARSLIPDQDGQDKSWRGYARTFFTAVTRQAHEAGVKDVSELYRLLVTAKSDELRMLVEGTPAQPFLDEHNSRMFDSIRSVTSSAVGALEYIGRQKAAPFSVRRWVNDDSSGVLFMPYKAGQIAALSSTISGWMRLAIFEAMNKEESPEKSRPLWFVVDELDALGQIDGLKDALARLRKFDGRCVLGFQSIAQVSTTYGQGAAHTIIENCGNSLILRCSASEGGGTARFASQLIGEREVLRTTVSKSRRVSEVFGSVSHNRHYSVEAAVLPSEVEQLPDLTGYLKYASDPEWQKVRLQAKTAWNQSHSSTAHGTREPAGAGMSRRTMSERSPSMDESTLKFGLLMESAQAHQKLAENQLERLRVHTRDLDGVVRDEIRRTLVDELKTLTVETTRAAQALRKIKRVGAVRGAVWSLMVSLICALIPIAVARWVLPSPGELAALRLKHDEMSASLQRLQQQGGRIEWRRCGETSRLCVRIDRKAPTYGEKADYFVVEGY